MSNGRLGHTTSKEAADTLDERFGRCPYATAQRLVGGKWALLVMHYLALGPTRFNELERLMPKMSPATLSAQLKTLTAYGLVRRTQLGDMPPVVEYSLTDIGREFGPVLDALDTWGEKYIAYLQEQQPSDS